MRLLDTLYDLISMRSFTTAWYWIALLGFWYAAGIRVLGIPYDLVLMARHDAQKLAQLEDVTGIMLDHRLSQGELQRLVGTALAALLLTVLFLLGFHYGQELAQAVFFFALPMALLALMRMRLAARLMRERPEGEVLCRRLVWHRFWVQLLGMTSIFVTVLWGMWHTLTMGVLGN